MIQQPHSVKVDITMSRSIFSPVSPVCNMENSTVLFFPFRILSSSHHSSGGSKHWDRGAAALLQLPCGQKPGAEVLPHGGLEHRLAWGVPLCWDRVWIPAGLQPPRTSVCTRTHQRDTGRWSKLLLFVYCSVHLAVFIVTAPLWASLKNSCPSSSDFFPNKLHCKVQRGRDSISILGTRAGVQWVSKRMHRFSNLDACLSALHLTAMNAKEYSRNTL